MLHKYFCVLWCDIRDSGIFFKLVHVLVAVAVCSDSSGSEIFPLPLTRWRSVYHRSTHTNTNQNQSGAICDPTDRQRLSATGFLHLTQRRGGIATAIRHRDVVDRLDRQNKWVVGTNDVGVRNIDDRKSCDDHDDEGNFVRLIGNNEKR